MRSSLDDQPITPQTITRYIPLDVECSACHDFGMSNKANETMIQWQVVCGYCCGTGRTPIPMAEVVGGHRGK